MSDFEQALTIDAYNRVTSYVYDVLGNLIETQYPDGTVTRTAYDGFGRAEWSQERALPVISENTTVTSAPGTRNIYDSSGRIISVERHPAVRLAKRQNSTVTSCYEVVFVKQGATVSATRTQYDNIGRVQYS